MNQEKLTELRACQGRGELFNAMAEDMSLAGELLDAAESAIDLQRSNELLREADEMNAQTISELRADRDRLKESIAITDRNFRAMQAERDELRAWKVDAEAVHEETRAKLDEWQRLAEATVKLYDNRTMVNRLRSGRFDLDDEEQTIKSAFEAARLK